MLLWQQRRLHRVALNDGFSVLDRWRNEDLRAVVPACVPAQRQSLVAEAGVVDKEGGAHGIDDHAHLFG
ncbi:MAG: hypothetical protein ACK55Z_18680, partial [bacterium]